MMHMKKDQTSYVFKPLVLLLALAFAFSAFFISTVMFVRAEEETAPNYIYFDLHAGDVKIEDGKYTGSVYLTDGSTQTVTGDHVSENKYYVYQSNSAPVVATAEETTQVTEDGELLPAADTTPARTEIPTYAGKITDFTNNPDVLAVEAQWDKEARELGRTPTEHKIIIDNAGTTCDMVLDDVWSTAQTYGSTAKGSIDLLGSDSANTHVVLRLKDDNRLGFIYYHTGTITTNTLTFTSLEGNGKTSGSLVVIGDQEHQANDDYYSIKTANHWNSVIGGTDNNGAAVGIVFDGGTVYAGSTDFDNCTSIGGGGNSQGTVIINGGKVTAVASSTGAAIGGGIAHRSYGGPGTVTINGGDVYAYNFGQPFAKTLSENGQDDMLKHIQAYGVYVAGTAIGGGSSAQQYGAKGIVEINGGYVYAESVGGSGIGGGNTVKGVGGEATVTINDGEVISVSKSGRLQVEQDAVGNRVDLYIPAGAGIGGGSSTNSTGGQGTVTITGGFVHTNGIGGGSSTDKTGGNATVVVEGGTIVADTIGGGFSDTYGYAWGNVKITGGTLNSGMAAVPVNGSGEQVYLTRLIAYNNENLYSDKLIRSIKINGVDNYGLNDVYTDSNAMLYIWIPADSAVYSCNIDELNEDGTVIATNTYEALEEADGKVDAKDIGILKYINQRDHCVVKVTSSSYYDIYLDSNCEQLTDGTILVEKDTVLSYYLQSGKDNNGKYYEVQPYIAVTDANGAKTFQRTSGMTKVNDTGLYSAQYAIEKDTQFWFEITGTDGTRCFIMDLTNGDINITESENGGITIEQNGFELIGYTGSIYLTTTGYPTSNALTVNCNKEEVSVYLDDINAASNNSIINIDSGTLNLSFSEKDNLIQSLAGSPITIAEAGTLHIDTDGQDSIKLDAAKEQSAISGFGALVLNDQGGFLKLNELLGDENTAPHISVGTYEYLGKNPKYTAQLYNGIFSFDLIGYVDSKGILHEAGDLGSDNKENFSARGIFRVYEQVKDDGASIDENGNLVLKLSVTTSDGKMGEVSVSDQDLNALTAGADYQYDTATQTLTIAGNAFKDGNLIIFGAAYGQIPHMILDYEGVYDAKPHTVVTALDTNKFAIYYSDKEQLTQENYKTAGKTTSPEYINQSEHTVHWFIRPIDEEDDYYTVVSGSNKVIITPGINEWTVDLTCPDVVLGNNPEPHAEAKWGTERIFYEFFKDKEGQVSIAREEVGKNIGDYYVRATVPADIYGNYETIMTADLIRFRVFQTSVFTANSRTFEKATGTETVLNIHSNGAFSIFYETSCKENMTISFDQKLEAGTKLTFITYPVEESETIQFHYYIVKDTDYTEGIGTNIPLTSFVLMGHLDNETDAHFDISTDLDKQVKYQFCVEANNELVPMQVSFGEMKPVRIQLLEKHDARFVKDPIEHSEYGKTYITVYPYVNGNGKRILAFKVKDISKAEMPIIVRLSDGTVPSLAIGDLFVFNLGYNTNIRGEYTLVLDYLSEKTYDVECDIRIVDANTDLLYSLAGSNEQNHKNRKITVPSQEKTCLYADILNTVNGTRIVKSNADSLNFQMYTNENSVEGITADLYVKENGVYKMHTSGLTISEVSASKQLTVAMPKELDEGTYRFVFKLNDAIYNYNIIISDL